MRYTLYLDRVHCIGCADCPKVCAKQFKMVDDGKAVIKGAPVEDLQSKKVPLKDFACAMRGVRVCPVDVIWMVDTASGKKLTKKSMIAHRIASSIRRKLP
ncbi:MAG TPA: ferredoxin [Candidatus Nanoarchaeia archaeon]|nr:ferredoxin [Candidatus Nanoarchaeia archaeon]